MHNKTLRLNKVLRELNISLDRAVEYLESKGIEIEARPTAKITNVDYHILLEGFEIDKNKRTISQELYEEIKVRKEELKHKNEERKKQEKEMINYEEQIINNYKTLIVTSGNDASNPEKGYPKPQCSFINNYEVIRITKALRDEYFPNSGHLIVLNNYTRDIKERFESTEFFKIKYQESKNFFEEDRYSVKYEVNNQGIEKLPTLIDVDINNILEAKEIFLPYKFHSYVYVRTDNKVYGPIAIVDVTDLDEVDDDGATYKYKIQSLLTNSLSLDKDYEDVIHVFDEKTIEKYIVYNNYGKNNAEEHYITNTLELLKNIEPIELILNEEVETTIKIIEDKGLPIENTDIVLTSLNEANKIRFEKYIESKSKSEKWIAYLEKNIFSKYLKKAEGKEYIDKYILENKENLLQTKLEKINEEAKEKASKFEDEINKEYRRLEAARDELRISIETTKKEKEKLKIEIDNLSNEKKIVKQKNEELTDIEQKLEDKKSELNLYIDIEDVKNEKEELEKDRNEIFEKISELINDKKRYIEELEVVKKELRDGTNDIVEKRYKEIKPYFDLMNGTSMSPNNVNNFTSLDLEGVVFNQNEVNLEDLIEDLDKFLQSKGRRYKQEEILNLVILYFQNLLIIFSGLPGIGKTSLSCLLSEFFTHKSCFLEMAVSKGWNSRKVLLGYNNPISNTYQYDENGFIEKIIRYNSTAPILPLNILLDEANLSPIEYYWSDFISIYDKDKNERYLNIDLEEYKEKGLLLPNKIRFMATINNDHTTERLSPRLIDRAPIITIENDNTKFFDTQSKIDYTFSGYYNFEAFDELLNPLNINLVPKEEDILIKVFNILKNEGSIVVSIRKINSIIKYCSASKELMLKYTANQYAHIDYAIAQFILPQIQGQGADFGNMLDKLIELFRDNQLSKSAKILKKIKDKGASFQVFSFFN